MIYLFNAVLGGDNMTTFRGVFNTDYNGVWPVILNTTRKKIFSSLIGSKLKSSA